jgi:hypothetical protein
MPRRLNGPVELLRTSVLSSSSRLVSKPLLAHSRARGKCKAPARTFHSPYEESIPVQPRVSLFDNAAIPVHVSKPITGSPVEARAASQCLSFNTPRPAHEIGVDH